MTAGDLSQESTAAGPGADGSGPPQPSMSAGTRVAHFEVREYLGRSAFGEVYRARDTHLDRMVARKLLAPRVATDELRERFRGVGGTFGVQDAHSR